MTDTPHARILCIEDEGDILDLLRIILERDGFECITALGGIDGVQKARDSHPDLILLDLMMPDMSGWEVLRHLQEDETSKYIPVIILTVRDRYSDPNLLNHAGDMAEIISKPFDFSRLTHRIRGILGLEPSELAWTPFVR